MKKLIMVLNISILLLSTGCWNNRELTELNIVYGIAFDRLENGNYEVTVQIVNTDAIKQGKKEGGAKAFVNVTSEGSTVFEAVRKLVTKINNKAFFSKVQLMVISENIAQGNFYDITDFFERENETRRRANLIFAKGIKAKDVLNMESDIVEIPSIKVVESLDASIALSKVRKVNLLEILKHSAHKGHPIVIPVIHTNRIFDNIRQEDLVIEGSAVIMKGKLMGYLSPSETRGYMFADNKVKSTIIVIPSPINPKKLISIEVIRSRGMINAKMDNKKLVLEIKIKSEGNIGEQQIQNDLTKPEIIKTLESEVEKIIKNEVENALITSKNLEVDILRFIDELYRNQYHEWETIIQDWGDLYRDTPVDVKVEFNLRRSGLIKEPVKPK